MEEETILIKAVVKRVQDGTLTVRLQDGFANAEVVVHKDHVIPYDSHKAVIVTDPVKA